MNPYFVFLNNTVSFEFRHLARAVRRLCYDTIEATEIFQEFADIVHAM